MKTLVGDPLWGESIGDPKKGPVTRKPHPFYDITMIFKKRARNCGLFHVAVCSQGEYISYSGEIFARPVRLIYAINNATVAYETASTSYKKRQCVIKANSPCADGYYATYPHQTPLLTYGSLETRKLAVKERTVVYLASLILRLWVRGKS